MNLKKSSVIFLLILFVILIFILGVRYGQRVEKTNKIINYLISLPPSPTVQPTLDQKLTFKFISNDICGIKFLYPDSLLVFDKYASAAGSFILERKEEIPRVSLGIAIACFHPKDDFESFSQSYNPVATKEGLFKNTKTIFYDEQVSAVNHKLIKAFKIINPKNKFIIWVRIEPELLPLFEKSLEFTP